MDNLQTLAGPVAVLLMLLFFGGSLYMSLRIRKRTENADGYMTGGGKIGFGISAASMTATWIWASSMYASATSGYTYGISGPIHYGLWGALMILLIYPFGKRIRKVAPKAHTIAEVMFARHGRSSQLMLAGSNVLGSVISLTSNLIAGGALISMLSPFTFSQGILAIGAGVLLYTLWSGFRASVLTDFAQVCAMLGAVIVIIPVVFFAAGGPSLFETGASNVTPQQADFFSSDAFFNQGAPYIAAVLAYAIGNQTIAQRLFAVREDLIKKTFITATFGYGATIIGIGMRGVIALYAGITPEGGDVDNLIPQMAATYLPPFAVGLLFIMVIGSLSSTADSDLAALSALVMTDIYGKNLARGRPNPTTMLWVGRLTMITATLIGVIFASMKLDILSMLIFVGALWGAIVFPVIASLFWNRVTNTAFTSAVAVAFLLFVVTRFELVSLHGAMALFFELLATLGGGVVIGLMAFGFFGRTAGLALGIVATLVLAPFAIGHLRDYAVLLSSLTAYGASAVVCTGVSLLSNERFDFERIGERVVAFQHSDNNESNPEEKEINACPVSL